MKELRLLTILLVLSSGCVLEEKDTVFLCPKENCEERIIIALTNANYSIESTANLLETQNTKKALEDATKRNIAVKLITQKPLFVANKKQIEKLQIQNIQIRFLEKKPRQTIIIDGKLAIQFSDNWTANTNQKNNEYIMFVREFHSIPPIKEYFLQNWFNAN